MEQASGSVTPLGVGRPNAGQRFILARRSLPLALGLTLCAHVINPVAETHDHLLANATCCVRPGLVDQCKCFKLTTRKVWGPAGMKLLRCLLSQKNTSPAYLPISVIDDAIAILMAFQSLDLEVVGLTTIFGNVITENATQNALHLCEVAGFPDLPVAEGSLEPLKGGAPHIADFVHGSDGLGNTFPSVPKAKKIEKCAHQFIIDKVSEYPNEVTILALGPLTNIALAVKEDKSFVDKVKKLVILGGAFFASGNISPAAEANIYGDPEAADIVFTSGAEIVVVGINVTNQVLFTDMDLCELRDSRGRHAKYVYDICQFYKDFHVKSDGVHGIFLHDPTCLAVILNPHLFEYKRGTVRVETQGISTGITLMDLGVKRWNSSNPWTGHKPVSVAWTVDVSGVINLVKELLKKPYR